MIVRRKFRESEVSETALSQAITGAKAPLLEWSHKPDAWRLRGLRLGLHTTVEKSAAVRAVIRQEFINREWQELERLHRVLQADANRVRNDPAALQRLGTRVAAFHRRVGELERRIETLLQNLKDRTNVTTPNRTGRR